MKTKIEITYWWKDRKNENPIDTLIEVLDNEAVCQIKKMWQQGYTSGELNFNDKFGWWELNTKRMEDKNE